MKSQQERFRWSLWPIIVGWLLALWLGWHGMSDLGNLVNNRFPIRGFVFGFLSTWPREFQLALAVAQIALVPLALPSFLGWMTGRVLFIIGETGITLNRLMGWRRIAWADIVKLEFSFGDAVFHLRETGKLSTLRFSPWTIGLDSDEFRALVERHQPRLTPDEDEGQPWGRSSSFNA
ncbi:MAG: PH domain-containing protein [Beijerinckiaceae bacterium]